MNSDLMPASRRTPDDHLADVLSRVAPLPAEEVPATDACGAVLAADARAQLPIPPFTNSAMDGFLVRDADLASLPKSLPVEGEVAAGDPPRAPERGCAVRIMTGAPVPAQYDGLSVVPVEMTDAQPGPGVIPKTVIIQERPGKGRTHIRPAGDDTARGDLVAAAGTLVDPATQAALISAGLSTLHVHRIPRVAVVSSGAELVASPPCTAVTDTSAARPNPAPAQNAGRLPDSNGPMLASLAAAHVPCATITRSHSDDSPTALHALLDELADAHDLIVTSGGVSAGAYDVIRQVFTEPDAGTGVFFGEVAQKPGAPQGLAAWRGVPVICLPGNPVAAFMSFHLYVAPALDRMRGLQEPRPRSVSESSSEPGISVVRGRPRLLARAGADIRPAGNRTLFTPVHLDFTGTDPLPTATPFHRSGAGSHRIGGLAGTRGFAVVKPDQPVARGDAITIYPYSTSY